MSFTVGNAKLSMQNVQTARRGGILLKYVNRERSIILTQMSTIPVKRKWRPTSQDLECQNYLKCTEIFNYPEKCFCETSFCQQQHCLNTY